jgi:hypothetical protein
MSANNSAMPHASDSTRRQASYFNREWPKDLRSKPLALNWSKHALGWAGFGEFGLSLWHSSRFRKK